MIFENKSFFLNDESTNNSETNKNFNKISNFSIIKKTISFIFITILLKIIVHFFIFPTEITYTNTNKKVYVQVDAKDMSSIRRKNYHQLERKYNKKGLIILGENVFYYPKEKERASIAKHIEYTFTDRQWLFPCVSVLLLWIINNNKKNNFNLFSDLFSKNIILIITLIVFSMLLLNIYEKTEKIKELSQAAISEASIAVNIAEESLSIAKNASSEAEEASSMAEDVIYNYE